MVGIILIIIVSLVIAVLLFIEIIGLVRDIKKHKANKIKQQSTPNDDDNKNHNTKEV